MGRPNTAMSSGSEGHRLCYELHSSEPDHISESMCDSVSSPGRYEVTLVLQDLRKSITVACEVVTDMCPASL